MLDEKYSESSKHGNVFAATSAGMNNPYLGSGLEFESHFISAMNGAINGK
jgi:hypothetical protein